MGKYGNLEYDSSMVGIFPDSENGISQFERVAVEWKRLRTSDS